MTVYLSDFADPENCFYENSLSDFEHDGGFAAEIEQWRNRSFRLRHNIELLIATDEYCNWVIDCSGYRDKPFILHESTF